MGGFQSEHEAVPERDVKACGYNRFCALPMEQNRILVAAKSYTPWGGEVQKHMMELVLK